MSTLAGMAVCSCGQFAVAPGKEVCRRCERGRPVTVVPPSPDRIAVDPRHVAALTAAGPTVGPGYLLWRGMVLPTGDPALTFDVPGLPVQQGSKTAGIRGGHAAMWDDNAKSLKPWRKKVTEAAMAALPAGWEPPLAPIGLLTFVFPRPKRFPTGDERRIHDMPTVKPDVDKLERAACDSITDAKVWRDDANLVDVHACKRYVDHPLSPLTHPGLHVALWPWPADLEV